MLRTWVGTALAALLAAPVLARADAFDNYTNPILAKVPASRLAESVKQLTPEMLVQHSRVLPARPRRSSWLRPMTIALRSC